MYEMQETTNPNQPVSNKPSEPSRPLNYLPLHPSADFSPFPALEFDSAVQEFCRNKGNHIIHKTAKASSTKTKTESYTTVNTPFSKVLRSAKVIINGDVAVGKTCLVNRFGHNIYSNSYQTTIGVDFDLQKFHILGHPYILQVSTITALRVISFSVSQRRMIR